ncbi:MAG: RsmB/NOP family class I SAM-dependent RNA methyltransferase [Devosia sp.]
MARSKTTPGLALRQQAAGRLAEVLKGASFAPFSASEMADGRDRALANRLVTTALRRHGHLNRIVAHLLDRGVPAKSGSFEAILRISLAQLLWLPELGDHSALFLAGEAMRADAKAQHLGKLMNAVLRRAQKEAAQFRSAPAELLFPDALREKWGLTYGSDAVAAFAVALTEGAPLDLTLRDDDPALVTALDAAAVLADSVRVIDRDRAVSELPGYAEGRFWVQDAAAAIPARLLDLPAGSRVLDIGAAPGGKTAQLCKAGYAVTALDSDADRMRRLEGNLSRLGYAAETVVADALTYQPGPVFDGIVLDAPCSATGIFRRHPEVIWHRDAADIAGRAVLQRKLLVAAAAMLKPGGTLIYCVCSLEPEEGEQQAKWLVSAGFKLSLVPVEVGGIGGWAEALTPRGTVRTHPALQAPGDKGGTLDGFFTARFRKG